MHNLFRESFLKLKKYCEGENFSGWDPYDGLNSQVFQATPLRNWSTARLFWIQIFKHNPVNLRRLFLIPKEHNPKGIALLLSGYCHLFNHCKTSGITIYGTPDDLKKKIYFLANLLLSMQSSGYSGACWGYNFDWQSRSFFFPKNTPTVVVTAYASDALAEAYEITGEKEYKNTVISSADFILNDLHRTRLENGFLFSYSPLQGNNTVYNASLLGSKLLARVYSYTRDDSLLTPANESIKACVSSQNKDGSWSYGRRLRQKWIDNFHTGFNLESIFEYMKYSGNYSAKNAFDRGMSYYVKNFFLDNGTPKYYCNSTYPIDIHSSAQLIITLAKTNKLNDYELGTSVLNWTIHNMQHKRDGYFFYQKKKIWTSRIPYMRWSEAWMFYSMSLYISNFEK